jgi:hypothetical protein
VTREDGSSLLDQWAPSNSQQEANWTELPDELQEQEQDQEQEQEQDQEQDNHGIHVPKSLPGYDLIKDLTNLQEYIANDPKAVYRFVSNYFLCLAYFINVI